MQAFHQWQQSPMQGMIPGSKPSTLEQIRTQLSIAHKALSEANAMAQDLGEDERLFGLADFKESIADGFHYTDAAIDLSHNLNNQDDV